MKKYLILLVAVMAFTSCEDTAEVSKVTSLIPFTIDTPDLIIVDDSEDKTLTIPITLSEDQVVNFTLFASLDEDATTATNGVDFVFEDTEIDVEGYVRTASITLDIIGDIDPDGEPEFIVINVGGGASNTNPFVPEVVQFTIQLNDFNGEEPIITLDWDGLLALPTVTGGDTIFQYLICGNGVDVDPVFLFDNSGTLEFFTYSDDYAACPEVFTGLGAYPNGTYVMLSEFFTIGAFFGAPAPIVGDFCLATTVIQPGVGSIAFEQDLDAGQCFTGSDLGYFDPGGALERKDVFEMIKDGTTYMFNSLEDGSEFGTIGRYAIGQSVYDAMNQAMIDKAIRYSGPLQTN